MVENKRVELADVLLRQGLISQKDLEKAEEYQRENGGTLSEVLVELKLVKE